MTGRILPEQSGPWPVNAGEPFVLAFGHMSEMRHKMEANFWHRLTGAEQSEYKVA